ncbi:zinc finger BED domain-containing protein RICESLEEPER 2 [Artemisia annua]|uniref:Zinc finger BED domain-containing protein RICESLEEPER 2 n=1 Tax=Artemisia annua TaxID=35608 RepID=A0A2U1LAT0_ARTAN|nr:zinc finger BED domain-containing protein RICESLEEPER 2 [Artemisia annua]
MEQLSNQEILEASNSTQIDLDNSDLDLGVEKNDDKRAKRKTTSTKRKSPKKKKPKTKGQESKSKWWKFFDKLYEKDEDGEQVHKAKCKYCARTLAADSHTNDVSGEGNSSSVATWKHDDERFKKALIKLFVVGELPFAFVKNEAFVEYTESLNAKFILPSRHKLSRDVSKFYLEERNKLKSYISKATNTVHFTTDTWTSHCQRVNYMALTAHFIDEEWVMHKRIINFRPINSHKGDDIGRKLLECVHEWGIKNVMTITVDNASSNDKALDFLIQRLPNIYDGGKHFQIRCFAHILNLIVKKGMTLKKCLKLLIFSICAGFVEFLEKFKVKTENMSASTKPLSHLFFSEILDIDTHLRKWQSKPAFKVMATKMRTKYERYWGKLSEINDFMYFAVLLDPTMKSQLISHGFRKIIRYEITPENPISNKDLEQIVSNMVDEVEKIMGVLFEMYKERCGFDSSTSGMCESMEPEATSPSHGDNDFLNDFYNGNDTSSIEPETELQRYLKEPRVELRKGQTFDILQWWKVNSPRFPLVARMDRDILAIQISTVASKSAFSTGGRVLDPYRTSLSTKIVEALICTQDWVRKSRKPINVDSLEDLFNDDEIVKDMENLLEKTNEKDNGKQVAG